MMVEALSVLEFYSGIGGMHYALNHANIKYKVIGAFDINTTANMVYKHNFPDTKLLQKNIEGFSVEYLDGFNADIWTMSPPCQPYTRQGKQQASNDSRSKSFLTILKILQVMANPPRYIFMENVKGFECSDTKEMFLAALNSIKFVYQEFLISPSDLGIPNSRTRYYLIAKHYFPFVCTTSPLSCTNKNVCNVECKCNVMVNKEDALAMFNNEDTLALLNKEDALALNNKEDTLALINQDDKLCIQIELETRCGMCEKSKLSEFIDSGVNESYLLSEDVLTRYHSILDVVNPDLSKSCCFTKAYGKYVEGTGSVFTEKSSTEVENIYKDVSMTTDNKEKYLLLCNLKLRYFTPEEIAKLMCFPSEFIFPDCITLKQKYRLLGNSVNVFVISFLMKWFLFT